VRILTRYILREVLSLSAIGITLFTFVIFMPNVGRILELAGTGETAARADELADAAFAAAATPAGRTTSLPHLVAPPAAEQASVPTGAA